MRPTLTANRSLDAVCTLEGHWIFGQFQQLYSQRSQRERNIWGNRAVRFNAVFAALGNQIVLSEPVCMRT